jgi:DNA-binding beta-propeller fold protein YncE
MAPQASLSRAEGPVAIAALSGAEAVVLHLRGRVSTFDMRQWTPGKTVYAVPADFEATDMSAGTTTRSLSVICLVLNGRVPGRNFVLQLVSGREVWTWLRARGVYTGVAFDATRDVAYAVNSTNNTVYRVRVGDEKQTPQQAAAFPHAARIGAIALDAAKQRLFVSDSDGRRIFVRDLERGRTSSIAVPDLGEIRALAWDAPRGQLYVADSGSEAIWTVTVDGAPRTQLLARDSRFRQPSGLTIGPQGLLVATDETSSSVFAVTPADRAVRNVAKLAAPSKR